MEIKKAIEGNLVGYGQKCVGQLRSQDSKIDCISRRD